MPNVEIALTGDLNHADSTDLLDVLLEAVDEGDCLIDATEVTKIDFGPLQVMVSASLDAAARARTFTVLAGADSAVAQAVSLHALGSQLALAEPVAENNEH